MAVGEEDEAPSGRGRGAILLAVTVVGLALLGVGLNALTKDTNGRSTSSGTLRVAATDDFDRAGPRRLGGLAPDVQWIPVRGVWGVADSQARVVKPPRTGSSLAVVNAASDGVVQVRAAAIAPGLGLAFRCRGDSNCWRLEAVPKFGTWNVVIVQRGKERSVGNLGTVPVASGTMIGVTMRGNRLGFFVDGERRLSLRNPALEHATRVGLSLRDASGATAARWDDFRVTPQHPKREPR